MKLKSLSKKFRILLQMHQIKKRKKTRNLWASKRLLKFCVRDSKRLKAKKLAMKMVHYWNKENLQLSEIFRSMRRIHYLFMLRLTKRKKKWVRFKLRPEKLEILSKKIKIFQIWTKSLQTLLKKSLRNLQN